MGRKRVGLKPVGPDHISQHAKKQLKDTEINNPENHNYRKMAALDFLENELKVKDATIISSKLSNTSPILWIEVQNEEIAEHIQKQSSHFEREARAIMYPPQEFFRTIKSIENNYKEEKEKNTALRYIVKLGQDNIELWAKQLREPQYTKQSLTVFGNIEEQRIERIITTPKFGQSPPKGRDTTLKRLRESTENSAISPKRFNINEEMMAEELTLSPGWNRPFQSTIISPPKEQQLNKIIQLVNNRIKPTSPTRRRTKSQDPKEIPTNTEKKNSNPETQPNQGKANPNTKKGEKIKEAANQQKQNHKENP